MEDKINLTNWNYAYYSTGMNRIQIYLGGSPENNEIYSVTSSELDAQTDYFQKDFNDLNSALSFINERYGHLNLILGAPVKEGSGCDTCGAHQLDKYLEKGEIPQSKLRVAICIKQLA